MKSRVIGLLRSPAKIVGLTSLLSTLLAAAWLGNSVTSSCMAAESEAPLRVAITPDYPPLVYKDLDTPIGLEVDFAKALGQELGRPVEFVAMRRDQLIGSLLERRTDIIMSGFSITKARQVRVRFSDPYIRNELRAIFPVKSASVYKTKDDLLKATIKIGVIPGTTADAWVKQNCPNAQVEKLLQRKDVPVLLIQTRRMDVYVDDSFALADMLSKHEADLAFLKEPLSEESLGWGIRPEDSAFLDKVNAILAKWKADGTLERTLDRWVPYLKNLRVKGANP